MLAIDSHTGGEPTRVIIEGGPDLGTGPLSARRARFAEAFDDVRRMVVLEPRGAGATVGALLCEPHDPACAAGVIFFDAAGFLGMCGHGTIGLAATLVYLGRLAPGRHRLETPVGVVEVDILGPHDVRIENVPSYRYRRGVAVDAPGLGRVVGDVAWGGNWFFVVDGAPAPLAPEHAPALTDAAMRVRRALAAAGVAGEGGAEIDHVEFFGAPAGEGEGLGDKSGARPDGRNFVLCPGGAYDRSPCGTGLSAKLACLAADGKLRPGEPWVQESLIGSRFTASYRPGEAGRIIPSITGAAYVCAETRLIFNDRDPFRLGVSCAPAHY